MTGWIGTPEGTGASWPLGLSLSRGPAMSVLADAAATGCSCAAWSLAADDARQCEHRCVMAELHAWVDESGSDSARDPNTYILAAALCAPGAMDDVRSRMLQLRSRGHNKLHWREETKPIRRRRITDQVCSCALDHVIVVRIGTGSETRVRPRRSAMKQLLHELDRRGVAHAIFESRGPADDRRDRQLHEHLRRDGQIDGQLKMSHVAGPADPGLWVADAVCGAVSSSRTGAPEYLDALAEQVTVITIDWRGNRL
jgi:hypothetical protein